MASTFVWSKRVLQEILIALENNLMMKKLLSPGLPADEAMWNGAFQKGNTVKVRKPVTFTAEEFNSSTGTTSWQEISESAVEIELNHFTTVPFKLNYLDQTLYIKNRDEFVKEFILPIALAIAQKIDVDAHDDLRVGIPYYAGASNVTPDALEDFANAGKILDNNKVPDDGQRVGVWDIDAAWKFFQLDQVAKVNMAGTAEGLRKGEIGEIAGIKNYKSQNVQEHTFGGYTDLDDVTAVGTADATTVVLTSAAGASTAKLLEGDLLTIDGQQYVVTADTANAIAGVVTASVYPALTDTYAADAVTFADEGQKTAGKTTHVDNLVFHKAMGVMTFAPLAPIDGLKNEIVTIPQLGITARLSYEGDLQYRISKAAIDVLWGCKLLIPELGCRYLG